MNPILYDTTLRDGTQREGLSLSAEDKVRIACRLDALGIGYIEGGWPGSNPKDAEFFRRIAGVPLHHAKIAAFGMTRHAGGDCAEDGNCRALVEAGTPVVTLVGKSSTLHVDRVLRTSRDENLRMIADSVTHFKALSKEVIYDAEHFFDGYRLDPGYALATLDAAAGAGADCVVLCDTNGGALPTDVEARVWEVRDRITAPLGIHPHNDSGLALANALAAVEAGCVHVQGTFNGYGERCGNLDLVQLIATLQLKLDYQVLAPERLRELRDAALVRRLSSAVRDDRVHRHGREPLWRRAGTGERDATRRRRGDARHGRGSRTGERARPRGPGDARAALPATRRRAPRGLQGPNRGRSPRHRGETPSRHRVGARRRALEHRRLLGEHPRG